MATNKPEAPGASAPEAQFPTTLKRISVTNRRQLKDPDPPAIDVYPNGRSIGNRAATEIVLGMVDAQGLPRDKFVLEVLGDEYGRCALMPVSDDILDGAKVTFYRSKGTMGFQIADLFKEYPKLRPVMRQRYSPTFTTNGEGKPCFLIHLTLGRDNPKVSKSPKSA